MGETEFPITLADGKVATDSVMDDVFTFCGSFSGEERKEGEAVFSAEGLTILVGEVFKGGVEVGEAGEAVGFLTAWDLRGPAYEERDAVAAFVDIGFMATVFFAGVVVEFGENFKVGFR